MSRASEPLTGGQIRVLEERGCTAEDWGRVRVAGPFDADRLRDVHFSGDVSIGRLDGTVELPGGPVRKTGLYHAAVHNCRFGDNVYVHNVENVIANYDIGDGVVIDHVTQLAVEGRSMFGNGTAVRVISETGGREVMMFDRLSAHLAYVLALYRHRPGLIARIEAMIRRYAESVASDRGSIGAGTRITDCRILTNVRIGPAAVLRGVSLLENGSINSSPADPCVVGTDVIARDFIFCSGARATDGTILDRCFVGQGTHLGSHYSAADSLFFANCHGYRGEACAVFAGPYTVTHHKSTLLIAGLFSFLNAGSGSNQSNHMYKLGPVHQGIVERGSKTASDSYVLWPARIGAYTLIMGRHYAHCDTTDLPFSYLIEHGGESLCVPAANLRTVGTVRDARKWPRRDERKDPDRLDWITFNLLTPYTVQKMQRGLAVLEGLRDGAEPTDGYYRYNGVKIKPSGVETGIRLYRLGIRRFLGNVLVRRLRRMVLDDWAAVRAELAGGGGVVVPADRSDGGSKTAWWLDLAGLYVPECDVAGLLDDIESGRIETLEGVAERFRQFHDAFEADQWAWVVRALEAEWGKPIGDIEPADLVGTIRGWIEAVERLDAMRMEDARKEFAAGCRIGFGVDGGPPERDADFEAVRGRAETNDFITAMQRRLEAKRRTATQLIARLEALG